MCNYHYDSVFSKSNYIKCNYEYCNITFEPSKNRRKFCCVECNNKKMNLKKKQNRIVISCKNKSCYNFILKIKYDVKIKFCSSSCAAKVSNKNRSDKTREKQRHTLITTIKDKPVLMEAWTRMKWRRHWLELRKACVYEFIKITLSTCKVCDHKLYTKTRRSFCKDHIHLHSLKQNEKYRFKFNVYNFPELFDLELLTTVGWYNSLKKNSNLNGMSRDHRISVSDSIKNNYDPYYISHPLNCELMLHSDNKKKAESSSMIYDDLVLQVNKWDFTNNYRINIENK